MLNEKLQEMKKDGEEGGFTLIELMVVVLIIGILMAIAIPTFLNLTTNAKKNAAEANLTTAIQDAASLYTQSGSYGTSAANVASNLGGIDSGVQFTAGTPTGNSVGVAYTSGSVIYLEAVGSDNNYYVVYDNQGSVLFGVSSTAPTLPATTTPASGLLWGTSWASAGSY